MRGLAMNEAAQCCISSVGVVFSECTSLQDSYLLRAAQLNGDHWVRPPGGCREPARVPGAAARPSEDPEDLEDAVTSP